MNTLKRLLVLCLVPAIAATCDGWTVRGRVCTNLGDGGKACVEIERPKKP